MTQESSSDFGFRVPETLVVRSFVIRYWLDGPVFEFWKSLLFVGRNDLGVFEPKLLNVLGTVKIVEPITNNE